MARIFPVVRPPSFSIGGIDAFTVLMLHFDGADASTSFPDSSSSGHTVTAVGDAQVDTAQSKFGGASGLLDGTNDYWTVPASANWNWGTGDFTVDLWVRFNSTARQYIFTVGNNVALLAITPSSGLVEVYGPSSPVINTGSTPFSTGVWYHIALVRNGNSWVVYRDGTSYVTATDSRSWGSSSDTLYIGIASSGTQDFNGWMDELRVSKGIARWTANFTPPSGPYTT